MSATLDQRVKDDLRGFAAGHVKSVNSVVKAALHIIERGSLNVPDVGCVNVKQAHAVLWWACWLQYQKHAEWHAAGEIEDKPPARSAKLFDVFQLILIGAGGHRQDDCAARRGGSHYALRRVGAGAQVCDI